MRSEDLKKKNDKVLKKRRENRNQKCMIYISEMHQIVNNENELILIIKWQNNKLYHCCKD